MGGWRERLGNRLSAGWHCGSTHPPARTTRRSRVRFRRPIQASDSGSRLSHPPSHLDQNIVVVLVGCSESTISFFSQKTIPRGPSEPIVILRYPT